MVNEDEKGFQDSLSKMSDEELDSYEAEISGASSEPEEPEIPEGDQYSGLESAGMGAVEGVPFLKDAVAGIESIGEIITDEEVELSLDTWGESYKRNKREIDEELNKAEKQNPAAFFAGDMLGGIGSTAFIPGALVTKIATSAAIGAADSLSRSEDRDIDDAIRGAAFGTAGGVLGKVAGKALKAASKKSTSVLTNLLPDAVKDAVGITTKTSRKHLSRHLERTGQSLEDFSDNLLKAASDDGGKLFTRGQNFTDTLTKVKTLTKSKGEKLGNMLHDVDSLAVPINGDDIGISLKSKVSDLFRHSDDGKLRDISRSIDDYVDDAVQKSEWKTHILKRSDGSTYTKEVKTFTGEFKEFNLTKIHQLQKDIRKRIAPIFKRATAATDIQSMEQDRKVATALGEVMDDMIKGVEVQSGVSLDAIKGLRKNYGNLSYIQDSLEDSIIENSAGWIGGLKQSIFAGSAARGSLMVGGAMMMGVPTGAAIVVGAGLNAALTSPKTPAAYVAGLEKLASMVAKNPNNPLIHRLSIAAAGTIEQFTESVSSVIAEENLRDSPIGRTIPDIKRQMNSILSMAEFHDKPAAKALREALATKNDEALATIMDGFMSNPALKDFFGEGVGIDGKLYNQADIEMFDKQINQANLSLVEHQRLKAELHEQRKIPQPSNQPAPHLQHQPRNKKAPNNGHEY